MPPSPPRRADLPFHCVALLLQGGGALGAYQAGVYEALAEADLAPDWIAGISIGAINAAIIAGNAPQDRVARLREFWQRITAPEPVVAPLANWLAPLLGTNTEGDSQRRTLNRLSATRALLSGAPGFFKPRVPSPFLAAAGSPGATSHYDTSPLRQTLTELVDFDLLNRGPLRFSVGAVNVRSGNFVYFDTTTHLIRPEHVMASGALPPGFDAVEIAGEHYWDGGLISNTPIEWVLNAATKQDTLAFQVDLWNARGRRPHDLDAVSNRMKEIQYSSRTRANTNNFKEIQRIRGALAALLEKLPDELKATAEYAMLKPQADRRAYSIVELIYRSHTYEGQSKDYEFSRRTMEDHWRSGYNDAARSLRHPEIFVRPDTLDSVSTFDLAAQGRE